MNIVKSISKRIIKVIKYIKVRKHLIQNKRFWCEYYKKNRENKNNSTFSQFCFENYIKNNGRLLELGCGNGRDAFFFAKNNLDIIALDFDDEEIKYLKEINKYKNLDFKCKDFSTYKNKNYFNFVYSRFTIHSISELQQETTIHNTYNNLKPGGLFFIEVRSTKDNMFTQSFKLSEDEGFTDHYRRFIDYETILEELRNYNFEILYSIESNGLAKYKNENPTIIRIVARKK